MKKFILSLLAIFTVVFGAKAADITDVLDNAWTGITGTSYTSADNLSASSDAVYSVQCAGGNSAIQLRSNNNNSGVVTTKSGGVAKTINVTWNGNTNAARILQVYGSNTAYSSPADLYSSETQGTLIGEIDVNTSSLTLNDPDEYKFIGFRSKSGALYLDKVEIIWTTAGGNVVAKPTLTASQSFVGSMTVEITSNLPVYYTLDGTDPTTSSTAYSEPFEITATTTVKAIAFDATANASSAVVSATYTALEKITIAAAQAADAGTEVYVEGDVVAAGDAGCVIYDGTDYIYYYAGSENTFQPGMKVRGVGKTSTYGGAKQLPSGSLTEIGSSDFKETGTPLAVTGAMLDQYMTDAVTPRCFSTVTGELSVSGNYYNITVEGAENAVASIIKPLASDQEAVDALNGSTVIVKGYLMYVNRKYVYFIATEVKERQTSIANQDFEAEDETNAVGIRTYAKDIKGEEVAQLQPVSGWTTGESGDAKAGGTYAYGSASFLGGEGYVAPPFSLFDGETKALGILAVWSATSQYSQQVYLEAGKYMLQVPVYNAGGTGNINKNLIAINGVAATTVSYPAGQWTVENLEFELTEAQMVDVTVGYTAANSGSAAMPHLFLESARLIAGEDAIAAAKEEANVMIEKFNAKKMKADALATIDSYGVGDGLFFYPQSAIDDAKAAVENASTISEIEAALATLSGSMNKPVAGQPYAVKNVDAGINLNVTASAVNISKNAAVYFTEVEGGWAISSDIAEDGAEAQYEYIFKTKTTNNTWTLAATENLSEAYVISVNAVEGGYTLTGANGTIGLDNITEGSSCYANKAIGNHGVWTIEEWTAPVYYTVTVAGAENCAIVADPTEAEEGDVVTLTVTPDDEFVGEGFKKVFSVTAENSDLVVELTETETGYTFVMPADNVIVNGSIVSEGDFNYLIKNPMYLLHSNDGTNAYYDNWNLSPELPAGKERNYDEMNLVTYSGNVNFSITQTIPEIEPGQYRLSVYAFYRAGSAQDEANRVSNGDVTHNLNMFAEVGDAIYTQPIMNLYEGATEVDVTGKGNHCLVPGYEDLFVPDGASDSRSFYLAGYYRNDLIVNVVQKGEMMIGVNHPTGMAYDGDYAPIGGWELERIGDPVMEEDKVYEGTIVTGVAVPADPYTMIASKSEAQTVTISNAEDGKVNITFSGYTFPMPQASTGEFTVVADRTVNSDGSIEYSCESFTHSTQMGQMSVNYNGSLTGTQASADATPTIIVKLQNETTETSVFAGTAEEAESALAEQYVEPVVKLEPGVYYVRNAATGKYFGPGNNWGTHASLIDEQVYNTFAKLEDGTYTMETMVANGGTNYYNSGEWMDGPAANFTIAQVEDGLWTIALNGKYYAATDNGVLAPTEENIEGNEGALWMFLTQEEIDAENVATLATATKENPVDATFLIKDPGFGRNRRDAQTVWNPTGVGNMGGPNNDVSNYCAESYHSNFSITQTIANAPKGVYKLNAQGFYRQDGSDNENLPVFFMNDATVTFPILSGSENSMATAGSSFLQGAYSAEPIFIQLDEEGTITVGARLENNTALWAIWDNFSLTYYGPDANIDEVQFGDLIEKVNELRALAQEQLSNDNVGPATKTTLEAALAATDPVDPQTVEGYNAAIETLTVPTNQAKVEIDSKPAIDAMYRLMESINVYTQEAYDAYKALADDYLAKWEDGTLSETVDNPYNVHGWHQQINFDEFLLSAWEGANVNYTDPWQQTLYINTWSTEGANDGTDFVVPFYECWTENAQSLGANTWTATMKGLQPNKQYTATAWTRVQRMNGNTDAPYGISFQIEGGEPVDMQNMQIVDNSSFFIAELTAVGTADAEGNLKIQFVIDESNNISWLSFQNVNYEKVAEVYSINYDQPENGWIQAPGDAFEGTQVVFHAGADQGKMIESVSVKDAEGNEVELIDYQSEEAEGGYAFIMPASDVTIEATVTDLKFEYSVTSESGAYYEALPIEIDLDAILAAIGATEDAYTVYVEAPHTGRVEGLRGETDGWHNAEGEWAPWNDGSVYYVQDDPENASNIIVGGFPGATTGPSEFTTKLVYVNPTTQAEVPVYITLIYPAPKSLDDIEIGDVVATTSVNYELTEASYVEKVVSITEADVQNILAALELESLDDADVYGYNPTTGKLVGETSGFDGWRDANGDFANWTGNAQVPACVKYTNGLDYYCYNITGLTDQTISTYWAIANDTKAVLVKIDFIYGTGDAINEINVDDALNNGNVFDLTGRRVGNVVKGHIYIVNGKKFLVK